MSIQAPRLSYNRIKQHATAFLRKYHPEHKIPIPIEEILDLRIGINIIPVPGLIDFHVDAYAWSDLENIVVDKFFYDKQSPRYRFTLAHETGHIVLHADILKQSQVSSVENYLDFVNDMGEEAHRWTEWQADCFAGLVLVPSDALALKFAEAAKMAVEKGLSPDDLTTRGYIADWISDFFEVSAQTIETRLVYDGLWEPKKKR